MSREVREDAFSWREMIVTGLGIALAIVLVFAVTNLLRGDPLLTELQLWGLAFGAPLGTVAAGLLLRRDGRRT